MFQQALEHTTEQFNYLKGTSLYRFDILITVLPHSNKPNLSNDRNIISTITIKLKRHMGLNLDDNDVQTALKTQFDENTPTQQSEENEKKSKMAQEHLRIMQFNANSINNKLQEVQDHSNMQIST